MWVVPCTTAARNTTLEQNTFSSQHARQIVDCLQANKPNTHNPPTFKQKDIVGTEAPLLKTAAADEWRDRRRRRVLGSTLSLLCCIFEPWLPIALRMRALRHQFLLFAHQHYIHHHGILSRVKTLFCSRTLAFIISFFWSSSSPSAHSLPNHWHSSESLLASGAHERERGESLDCTTILCTVLNYQIGGSDGGCVGGGGGAGDRVQHMALVVAADLVAAQSPLEWWWWCCHCRPKLTQPDTHQHHTLGSMRQSIRSRSLEGWGLSGPVVGFVRLVCLVSVHLANFPSAHCSGCLPMHQILCVLTVVVVVGAGGPHQNVNDGWTLTPNVC